MMLFIRLFIISLLLVFSSGIPKPSALVSKQPVVTSKAMVLLKRKANDEYIPWVPDYRLNWDDFLCEPKRNTDAVASTSTALGIAYLIKDGKLTYQVTCKFSKVKSWGLVRTPYILAHEQGHFDITEIFARKLHQSLQSYAVNRKTFQKDINAIYDAVVQAKEAFQMAYDGETDHSRNRNKQEEWLERIETLLQDTQPFANYP